MGLIAYNPNETRWAKLYDLFMDLIYIYICPKEKCEIHIHDLITLAFVLEQV